MQFELNQPCSFKPERCFICSLSSELKRHCSFMEEVKVLPYMVMVAILDARS